MTLKSLKKYLNIKYFMAGYLILLLFFSSLFYHDLAIFLNGLAIILLYSVFDLLWTYWLQRIWYLPVSSWISALVLSIVAMPKPPLLVLIALPLMAVISKHILHLGKDRHIFNPAACALIIVSLFTPVVFWWGVTVSQLDSGSNFILSDTRALLFLFMLLAAVIIMWRQNRWHITLPFFISYGFFLSVLSLTYGLSANKLPVILLLQISGGVLLFFSTVMIIEPITSTFQTKRQEVFYGASIGFISIVFTFLLQKFNLTNLDPLILGLLGGNLLVSLLFLPNKKTLSVPATANATKPMISGEPSYWFRAVPNKTRYPKLNRNIQVDAIIIGGGMAGLSSAYFLSQAGIKTAVVEAATIGSGDSGYTTACATRFLDSLEATLTAWNYSDEAIAMLRKVIKDEKIDCQWSDVDAVCFTRQKDKISQDNFFQTVKQLKTKNNSIEFLKGEETNAAVGFPVEAAYRLKVSEGIFHIRQFLLALAQRATDKGLLLFEHSEVIDITRGQQVTIKTAGGSITAPWLIVATGVPTTKFFPTVTALLHSSISYVIDVKLPKTQPLPAGFFWDDTEPYHYYRSVGSNEFILGGEDWKITEPKRSNDPHADLKGWLQQAVGEKTPVPLINSWEGRLFSTPDTLPLIGPHRDYGENIIFMTGWAGNGMAQGFFAGTLTTDLILHKENIYHQPFSCNRSLEWNETPNKVTPKIQKLNKLVDNEGVTLEIDGQKLAVIKTPSGIKAFSTTCPHKGCKVDWNDRGKTWDCPCHGSRFKSDGTLLRGPAERGLDEVKIRVEDDHIKLV